MSNRGGNPRVLFVQATNPGAYPPLIHASSLMAEAGWEVTLLSAPIDGIDLALNQHPRIKVEAVPSRPSYVMDKLSYASYAAAAARLALRLRPHVVYASDPLGAGPGLLAARLARATLVYHEHDTPLRLHPILMRARKAAARAARLVVFPNEARARIAQADLQFSDDKLHIVWNVPRRIELVSSTPTREPPLIAYYHGNISPETLPETVALAVRRMAGRVKLHIVGYEAANAQGYVRRLVGGNAGVGEVNHIEYIGKVSRADLLTHAARAHVGLALMPRQSNNLNMQHLTGASNKPFDYMAAGLALLVSDLPDWTRVFVKPGFGVACNPADANSVSAALGRFIDHPEGRRAIAARARNKIETEWNYETVFAPILKSLINA